PLVPVTPRGDVVQVSGLIDRVEADFISRSIDSAGRGGAEAVVFQINSRGGTISRREQDGLVAKIRTSKVPVAVWVGQTGAKAEGPAAAIVEAADFSGAAP